MADKEELILDLLARNKMGSETAAAAKDIDKVGTAADATAKKTDKMTTAATAAGKKTDDLGDEAQDAATRIGHLDREIGKLNQDLILMAAEMAGAADKAARADFAKGIRKAQREIKELEGSKKILGGLIPEPAVILKQATAVGTTAGSGMLDGLKSKLGAGGGALVPVLAGAAIASAPVIGAVVSSAVIGGAGIGGIVGGVILAAKDQRVAKEGQALGNTVYGNMQASARRYFVEPTLKAIDIVGSKWGTISKDVDRLFANTADLLEPLVRGVTTMVGRITRGIADLSEGAGPVIDVLSNGLANIGDAVGDVFSDLKDNGVDAAVALRMALGAVEGTIRLVGGAVNALTESFGFLAKIGAFGKDAQQEYIRLEANAKIAAEGNRQAAASLDSVTTAGAATATAISGLVAKMVDLDAQNRTLYGSTTTAAQAIADMKKAIETNGHTLDEHTQKGRNNRTALLRLAEAFNTQEEAAIAANGVGPQTDAVAAANRRSFIKLATELTGSKTKARQLANELLGIPNVRRTVKVDGLAGAKAVARNITATLNAIRDETVHINYQVNGTNSSALRAAYAKNARASGGSIVKNEPYVVGEHGPEIVQSDAPARVLSTSASRGKLVMEQMAARSIPMRGNTGYRQNPDSGRGGGWSGGQLKLVVGGRADSKVAELVNYLIRSGDIVVTA